MNINHPDKCDRYIHFDVDSTCDRSLSRDSHSHRAAHNNRHNLQHTNFYKLARTLHIQWLTKTSVPSSTTTVTSTSTTTSTQTPLVTLNCPIRLKPRAPWINTVGGYAMVETTTSPELTRRVAFNTQKRATFFTMTWRVVFTLVTTSQSFPTSPPPTHKCTSFTSLMEQQPLICGADDCEQPQCSVGGVPKKLLVCIPEDGRYGIFAADLGYSSVDCQEGGYRLDVHW